MVPGCSLDAPWVLLDPPKIKLEKKEFHETKSKNLGDLEFCKDARRKNNRDLSGQNPVNFHGVPFGDKSDAS